MYALAKIHDTVRVPPERFGEDLNEAIKNIVQKTFEGTIRRNHGLIVVVDNITPLGDGIVIHGDGGMYQKVEFEALTFNPLLQELVDGIVCEIVEFGAFCHIGPLDALLHMSQIMNDYVDVDVESGRIQGKETKRVLKVGDPIRARIVAVSLNELSARESKIGLTMRQPALGAHEWLAEPKDEKRGEKKKDDRREKRDERRQKK
ncbi:MAG: DNA-directed RNA polymerase [Thermoplasmata archaeon M11B2D]|nr:MAG: DNA-directed RNA polymerase [Thermoplasmata archaeon M11B2D]PNX53951.1 MAG: DNA-directed RNA polymerase [Thermoplasmata archaeon M9B2D]